MAQEIRDQAITTEMVLIEIMVAIVIKIQHKRTGELEVKPVFPVPEFGTFDYRVSNSFKFQKGEIKTCISPKTMVRQVNRQAKIH